MKFPKKILIRTPPGQRLCFKNQFTLKTPMLEIIRMENTNLVTSVTNSTNPSKLNNNKKDSSSSF